MMIIPLSARIPQNPLTTCTNWSKSSSNLSLPSFPAKLSASRKCKGWNVRIDLHVPMRLCIPWKRCSPKQRRESIRSSACGHIYRRLTFSIILQRSIHRRIRLRHGIPAFRSATAQRSEAMQKWRGGSDTTAPLLTLTEFTDGERIGWNIASDEPIFSAGSLRCIGRPQ